MAIKDGIRSCHRRLNKGWMAEVVSIMYVVNTSCSLYQSEVWVQARHAVAQQECGSIVRKRSHEWDREQRSLTHSLDQNWSTRQWYTGHGVHSGCGGPQGSESQMRHERGSILATWITVSLQQGWWAKDRGAAKVGLAKQKNGTVEPTNQRHPTSRPN